jgi:maltose alpha-D-glucosyltransferase/alpha-amylase
VRLLESEVLPSYLSKRRWFASKDQKLNSVRLAALTTIEGAGFAFTEIEADVGDHCERYVLPLSIAWGTETTSPLYMQLALARVRRNRNIGHLTDAFAVPQFTYGVLMKLKERAVVPTVQKSEIRFIPTDRLATLDFSPEAPPEIRWLAAEQSNSSLVIGDQVVLKLVRRLVGGIHPEAEMSRYLTKLGYANTGPLFGEVVRVDPQNVPHTLAILQGFIDNQGDAWNYALDYLRRTVDEAAVQTESEENAPERDAQVEAFQGYATIAGVIGRRLGELHVALASPTDDEAFSPRRATKEDVQGWIDGTLALLESALDIVTQKMGEFSEHDRFLTQSLVDRRDLLTDAVRKLVPVDADALCIRIHGDFHLGQVLMAQGDAYLIDFEGEPARSLDERRKKTSPLRDVAGLLRSLSYASAAAQSTTENAPAQTADRKRAFFERMRAHAEESFLRQYGEAVAQSPEPIASDEVYPALLDLFLIEKAAYEIRYEAANRPTWIGLPLRGLASLASRMLGDTGAPPAPGTRPVFEATKDISDGSHHE